MKVDDEIVKLEEWDAVRVPAGTRPEHAPCYTAMKPTSAPCADPHTG
jgi:hypothetical protein